MSKEILQAVADAFGYENIEDCSRTLNLEFETTTHSWNGMSFLNVGFKDVLHKSYSGGSQVSISSVKVLTASEITVMKKRVKARERQMRILDEIKRKGEDTIVNFLEESFKIPLHLIEIKDIVWTTWKGFRVAGQEFSYDGTITDKSFYIYTSSGEQYKEAYNRVKAITDFYMLKEEYLEKGLNAFKG